MLGHGLIWAHCCFCCGCPALSCLLGRLFVVSVFACLLVCLLPGEMFSQKHSRFELQSRAYPQICATKLVVLPDRWTPNIEL